VESTCSSTPVKDQEKFADLKEIKFSLICSKEDFSEIYFCKNLTVLNLRQSLRFNDAKETQVALSFLINNILASGCTLKELDLSLNAIGPHLSLFSPILTSVEKLYLHDVGLNRYSGTQLFSSLPISLKILSLSLNNLDDSVLNLPPFQQLEVLDVSSCRIPSETFKKFLPMLAPMRSLRNININDNAGRGTVYTQGFIDFIKSLPSLNYLQILKIGDIGICERQAEELCSVLLSNSLKLEVLDISYSSLTERSYGQLFEAIENECLPCLKELYLDGNPRPTTALYHLLDLKKIYVYQDEVEDEEE